MQGAVASRGPRLRSRTHDPASGGQRVRADRGGRLRDRRLWRTEGNRAILAGYERPGKGSPCLGPSRGGCNATPERSSPRMARRSFRCGRSLTPIETSRLNPRTPTVSPSPSRPVSFVASSTDWSGDPVEVVDRTQDPDPRSRVMRPARPGRPGLVRVTDGTTPRPGRPPWWLEFQRGGPRRERGASWPVRDDARVVHP